MLQQSTIQSRTSKPLKPLVEVAIRKQLTSLRHGIARTRQQLVAFENHFGMSTTAMEHRLQTGELSETLAAIDWRMELAALRLLEEQYTALNSAEV